MGLRKSTIFLVLAGLFTMSLPIDSCAYDLSARTIYQQAKKGNVQFFQLIKRYHLAVDTVDVVGNTAYCLALREKNVSAMEILASQGADVEHPCVKRVQKASQNKSGAKYSTLTSRRLIDYSMFPDDKKYLWYGLGTLAVGGGIAAIVAGNGGGGSGGSSGGGGGGSTPLKYLPTKPADDTDPPAKPAVPTGALSDMTADEFRTDEFLKTNDLNSIKAAEAYSYIYQKDENGDIFSHQANSSDALATIKVGVLDTGVYTNKELAGKVAKGYDYNKYNNEVSIWGHVDTDGVETYVFLHDNRFYGVQFWKNTKGDTYFSVAKNSSGSIDFSEEDLKKYIEKNWSLNISNMYLMNGGGGRFPGVDTSELIFSDILLDFSVSSWYAVVRELSHGTHVAGIIAANKDDEGIHGVAFENASIYATSWDLEQQIYEPVKKMVDDGVTVLNHSWGIVVDSQKDRADYAHQFFIENKGDDDTLKAYVYAANNKAAWVQETGNDAHHYASLYNGIGNLDLSSYGYSGAGQYEAPYIAVAALDADTATVLAPAGQLASWSNWCKGAESYCIAAPGEEVVSSVAVKDGNIAMSGTSMATPVVAGSIALLNGYYPWLSAQNVAWLLLQTANKSGDYENSDKYGRGALDLDSAITTPVGTLSMVTSNSLSSLVPVQSSKLATSSVMSSSVKKALPEKIMVFDVLKRPFEYNISNMVSQTHASNANLRNEVSRAGMFNKQKKITNEKTGFQFSRSEAMNSGGQANLATVDVIKEDDAGKTRFYYAENSQYATEESVLRPSENPYFAMNKAYGAENTLNLSETSKLKLSLQTGENGLYGRDYEQDKYDFDERSYAVGAEYSFNLTDYLELATVGGMLYEEDAILGMNGRGALAIRDGSTYYMGLKAKLNLTPNVAILAAYYRGYTEGQTTSLMAISGLETESFMLAGEYQLNKKDKVGLSFSSPLSVRRGHASFNYASGRDNYSDTVYMQKLTRSLKPAAKEYDVGVYYLGEPQEDLNVLGKVEARFNADGEKGVTDYIGIMGAQYLFPK